MPRIKTLYFNELEYAQDSVFHFAAGIPGFEQHTAFLFIERAGTSPLVFMQSLHDSAICFIVLPASSIDPDYRLELMPEEAVALGLPYAETPSFGPEILPFALVTLTEGAEPVANLMSPIVLNLRAHKGIQAIQLGSPYALRHPLSAECQAAPCS